MAGSVFYEKIDYMTPNYDVIKSFENSKSQIEFLINRLVLLASFYRVI